MTDSAVMREATEGASLGATELSELTAFCMASVDDLLAPSGEATWASSRLLDGLGVILHGSGTAVGRAACRAFPPGTDGVCAWPHIESRRRVDDAIFVLGVFASSENYADTGLGSVAHVNSIVVPALLVGVQERPVTGREALAALVVGYNVMEWAGASLNGGRPRMAQQLRGFRPTSSAGPLATVAVVGRLMGISAADLANALGLACSQGGGLRVTNGSPTSAIRIQSGEALRRGVHAVALAQAGITSHPGILRCPGGYFPSYAFGELGRYQLPVAGTARDLMTQVSMKLDCTPHTLVTMLDAVRAIRARREFTDEDVSSVTVRVPAQHEVISGGDKAFPTTFSEAAGHVQYCIATAMLTGSNLFPAVIEGGLTDERIRALTRRITLEVDDDLTALFDSQPMSWPSTVEVLWEDGHRDRLTLDAPETVSWTAEQALEHAACKTEALLGGRAVSRSALAEEFATVESWPDLWVRLRDHVLTSAAPDHD